MIQLRNVDAKSSLLNGTRLERRRKKNRNCAYPGNTKLNLGDATAAEEEENDSEGDAKKREI